MRTLKTFCVLVAVLITVSSSRLAFAKMSDAEADLKAKSLWGAAGMVRKVGANYQAGCKVSGSVVIVASAHQGYDEAFSKVNLATNGPRVISATAYDAMRNSVDSDPITVFLCNP